MLAFSVINFSQIYRQKNHNLLFKNALFLSCELVVLRNLSLAYSSSQMKSYGRNLLKVSH